MAKKTRKNDTTVREHALHVPISKKNPTGITIRDRHVRRLNADVVKALIASESGFRVDPPGNKKAFGIIQITPSTLKIVQDPKGEAKEFIFNKIRKKDLKNPDVAIPIGVRWIFRKRAMAVGKLGKVPTHEEIVLEYKGLLKSKTGLKDKAFNVYKEHYDLLKKK